MSLIYKQESAAILSHLFYKEYFPIFFQHNLHVMAHQITVQL